MPPLRVLITCRELVVRAGSQLAQGEPAVGGVEGTDEAEDAGCDRPASAATCHFDGAVTIFQVVIPDFGTVQGPFQITALEFSYKQAPLRMKSFIMALYLLSISTGNLFTALVNDFMVEPLHATGGTTGAETWVVVEGAGAFAPGQKIDFAGAYGRELHRPVLDVLGRCDGGGHHS